MNSQKKSSKKHSGYQFESNRLQLFPLLFAIAIIPLIVLGKEAATHLEQYAWYAYDTTFDFFLYFKSSFLIFTGIILLIFLAFFFYQKRKEAKWDSAFIFLAIYGFLAILSSLCSKYRLNSLTGIPEQFESVFVLLTYCLLCFYSFQMVRSEKNLSYLIKGLVASISYLILLGITQLLGHDLLTSPLGESIITSTLPDGYSITLNFGRTVFLTLFNPNYVGVYCALTIPILITLLLYTKGVTKRILYFILTIGLFVCLVGSGSATGMITVGISLLFLLLLNRHLLSPYKKFLIPVLALFLIAGIGFSIKMNLPKRIYQLLFTNSPKSVERIDTDDDCVRITYNNKVLEFSYELNEDHSFAFSITDGEGNVIPFTKIDDQTTLIINDTNYPQITVRPVMFNDIYSFGITLDETEWYFTKENEEHSYYYINSYGKQIKMNNSSESALPENFYSFATNRGFIWSKTIPLLKNHILLGTGADCFVFEFPNDDYVEMYQYGFLNQLMTKPHNLYLQIGVQTGVISLIAFLLFYLCYFIKSIKLYLFHPLNDYMKQMGAAILVATTGYMISGLINDSTVTVAPLYWVLLGIGFSVNSVVASHTNVKKCN